MRTREPEERKRFAAWLKEHRVVLGLNQAEAGRRAGISRTQWIRLERGESGTRRDNIPKIAKAIHADLHEAYRMAGYAPPATDTSDPDFIERFKTLPQSVQDDIAVQIKALCKKYAKQQSSATK